MDRKLCTNFCEDDHVYVGFTEMGVSALQLTNTLEIPYGLTCNDKLTQNGRPVISQVSYTSYLSQSIKVGKGHHHQQQPHLNLWEIT